MKRPVKAMVAAVALTLTLAFPAGAGAETKWVCTLADGTVVTFVTAPDAALHGITQANSTAGVVFHDRFGENCVVNS
jgi:hypothetical protein